ncbi:mandelate racemase/muconate lactonizing enzyme family protein [Micromonospora sp. WMMD1082]|uniref:mandelate racemase/muconate lactonizing enzyme family protein n=1 Tax=Micromonospora sp. WMMD1082 TaxID=3016104 RepID=UPI0024175FB0|nr:mandelate racemase/muconate lactonizing enzyme family protein [Micromonospora sp. WMMD1082]MDG4798364.1 mandelate racemase/muconate lactonizing enzyme family protein [Micromonospora sp. WMMD1082]
MRIVEVREATVPIRSGIANAYISFAAMTASVVAVVCDVERDGAPLVGYGFNSNGRYGVGGLLRERFVPRLLGAEPGELLDDAGRLDPVRAWPVLMRDEKPGGHGERAVAVGVLDMALWDLAAKLADRPLWSLLADRFRDGTADESVFVYAAGGYYQPGAGLGGLRDEMRRYLDLGYSMVKMKIGGASLTEDLRRIEAVLAVVGSGDRLAVDANGRFDLETALAYGDALAPYGLAWYEEAGDPLDYELNARLAERYPGALATGENLFSLADARNLLRYGGLRPATDVLQFDCALSYGLVEYRRILAEAGERGWSRRRFLPHGGHQMSLNIAAGLGLGGNESYPDLFPPFNGFADGIEVVDGYVRLPDAPGIGLETKADLHALLRERLR